MQLQKFSQAAQKVLIESRVIAKKNHSQSVEPEHLALALIMTGELKQLLLKKKVEHKELLNALMALISNLPVSESKDPSFSIRLIQALGASEALSISKGHENIFVSDLFLSLVENRDKYGALGNVLGKFFLEEKEKHKKHKATALKEESKSLLFSVSDNINYLIKNDQIDPIFGREEHIERLIQILSRKSRNNPILIGEPGVGRASIVYALAKRINDQNIPAHLISKEILALDIGALVAGTTLRGQFEERMKKLLMELVEEQGHYILFVRDLSELMGAGGEGASDAANLLKPSLARGTIQMIGLVTPEAYQKRIEADASFERYFQPIWVFPPSTKECEEILLGLRDKFEQFHGVFIDDDALKAAIELGSRHLSGQVLPQLALDVLDEACSRHRVLIDKKPKALEELAQRLTKLQKDQAKIPRTASAAIEKLRKQLKAKTESYQHELSIIESMRAIKSELAQLKSSQVLETTAVKDQSESHLEKQFSKRQKELLSIKKSERFIDPWVKRDDIAAVISQETGIPVKKMMQTEREKLSHMEDLLSEKVIGQKEAIAAVANAIRRARVGLKDPKRPIGSFLFLGPTGVGKTELARTLTNFLFDDERAMIRFDMSEFMERHSVARLIGAPPGYEGSKEGGQLTEKVRRKPYSVVLFDEIEKAHTDVLNVLLQVLDEGRLTDSKGHLVQFSNTVIIMTSNVGSDILLRDDLATNNDKRALIMERLLQYLRPEMINRIDEIVIFNAIDREGIIGIADLMLKNVQQRLEGEGFLLSFTPEAKDRLIEEGYSKEFGARPLKRAIAKLIENPLAMRLIQQQFIKGDHIEVGIKDGEISFSTKS